MRLVLCMLSALVSLTQPLAVGAESRPNLLVILADDNWGWLSANATPLPKVLK